MDPTSAAVAELLDKAAIREGLDRYCRGVDRMDKELARSVWHDDGTCDYVELFTGSASDLLDVVWQAHSQLDRHSHQIANTLIEVDGDRAVSETYVTATLWGPPAESGVLQIVSKGRYLDRWSKRDGRWAIDHRIELGDLTTMTTIPTGSWTRAVDLVRRDHSDPSYQLFETITEP